MASNRKSPIRKAFLLRISEGTMKEMRTWWVQEMRSLNAHIEYVLKNALIQRKGEKRKVGKAHKRMVG